jgi:ABC-type sugar transport system permease subunit
MAKLAKTDRQILKQIQKSDHQNLVAFLFLAPWLIGFVIFTIYPFFRTIFLSFNDVQLTGLGWETTNVGLENYFSAFFGSVDFVPYLITFITLEVTYVPTIVIFSFILAMLLNRELKFRSGFRTIFFLPVIVLSGTVMDQLMNNGGTTLADFSNNIIFKMLLNYNVFLAKSLLDLFQNFTMVLWFTGIPIILFINGLQRINKQLFEAAQIDGATQWQILWKITIPIIKPTALIVAIFTIVQIGMYNINPLYSLIREIMERYESELGIASAYSIIYTIVVLVFVGLAFVILGTRSDKQSVMLTSVQKRNFEQMKAKRQAAKEVSQNG